MLCAEELCAIVRCRAAVAPLASRFHAPGAFAVTLALVSLTLASAGSAQASIVYERGGGVWIADNHGSNQRMLVSDGESPRISSDGGTVTFAREISRSNLSYFDVPASGGTPKLLIQTYRGAPLHWAPDSRSVAAVLRGGKLVVVDVATGGEKMLASGASGDFSFSPSGKRIAYASHSKIYSVSTAGGHPKLLVRGGFNSGPLWGAKLIVFHREAKRPPRGPLIELYTVRPNGGGVRQLTHTKTTKYESGFEALDWSKDGSRLLAIYFADTGTLGATAVGVDPRTGRVHRIGPREGPRGFFIPTKISRDGRRVLGYDSKGICTRPYGGGPPTYLVRLREGSLSDWTQ